MQKSGSFVGLAGKKGGGGEGGPDGDSIGLGINKNCRPASRIAKTGRSNAAAGPIDDMATGRGHGKSGKI